MNGGTDVFAAHTGSCASADLKSPAMQWRCRMRFRDNKHDRSESMPVMSERWSSSGVNRKVYVLDDGFSFTIPKNLMVVTK